MSKGYTYILECADGSYYTGSTKDLELRLQQHQNGEGANHTRKHLPVKLVYFEEFARIDEAYYREKQIQGWSRKKKEALINGDFDKLSHLSRNYTEYGKPASTSSASKVTSSASEKTSSASEETSSASKATSRSLSLSKGETKNSNATVTEPAEVKKGYKKTKLGEIPVDWEVKSINKLIYRLIDCEHKTPSFSETGHPYVRTANIRSGRLDFEDMKYINDENFKIWTKRKVPQSGDVLLTREAPAGELLIVPEDCQLCLGQRVVLLEINSEIFTSNYFVQFFYGPSLQRYLDKIFVGTTVPRLNISDINKLPIAYPPLPEQQKIAQILSTWDKAIEQSQNLIEQLKSRKKGLMQQLLTGKTRLKGCSSEWKKYQLGDLASNYNLTNKDNKVQEVLSCTKYDGLVRSLEYFGRKVYGDDLSKYKVVPSGYFAYATNHIEEGSIGYQDKMDFGLVSPMYTVFKTNKKVDDSFFYKLLKTDRLIYYYQSNMSGSIARRGGLRWNAFETIAVEIPSSEEQQAIAKVLTTADTEIKTQETYLAQLQAQKKGLMQQLLTGQKRVRT